MSHMTAVQIRSAGAPFEIVTQEIPEPSFNTVRVKVQACGVCHSDLFVKEGLWPDLQYPRIAGHEIAGVIDAVGPEVTKWKKGDRVGVGWHGGHCFQCVPCRQGDLMGCHNFQITGIHHNGGYAQYMIARYEALASIPDPVPSINSSALKYLNISAHRGILSSHDDCTSLCGKNPSFDLQNSTTTAP